MIKILHLSDLHYLGNDEMKSGIRLSESLETVSHYLARPEYEADVIVVTGDVLDRDSELGYDEVVDTLENFAEDAKLPMLMTLGNHDKREKNNGLVPDYVNFTAKGYRFIGFENIEPEISDDIVEQLKEDLSEDSEHGTILAFHHSPIESPVPSLRDRGMMNRSLLQDILAGSDVRLMLTGHYHHAQYGLFGDIPVWTSPALSNHTKMNPEAGTATAFVQSGFSYVVVNDSTGGEVTETDSTDETVIFGPTTSVSAIPIWLNTYPIAFTKVL